MRPGVDHGTALIRLSSGQLSTSSYINQASYCSGSTTSDYAPTSSSAAYKYTQYVAMRVRQSADDARCPSEAAGSALWAEMTCVARACARRHSN